MLPIHEQSNKTLQHYKFLTNMTVERVYSALFSKPVVFFCQTASLICTCAAAWCPLYDASEICRRAVVVVIRLILMAKTGQVYLV